MSAAVAEQTRPLGRIVTGGAVVGGVARQHCAHCEAPIPLDRCGSMSWREGGNSYKFVSQECEACGAAYGAVMVSTSGIHYEIQGQVLRDSAEIKELSARLREQLEDPERWDGLS